MNVTADGRPHLGTAIGIPSFVEQYVSDQVNSLVTELKVLTSIAVTQPHAAFLAFMHGLISNRLFVARIIPNVGHLFQPLEDCARNTFSPAVTGRLRKSSVCHSSQIGGLGYYKPNPLIICEIL